jgi:hypothetical protein
LWEISKTSEGAIYSVFDGEQIGDHVDSFLIYFGKKNRKISAGIAKQLKKFWHDYKILMQFNDINKI